MKAPPRLQSLIDSVVRQIMSGKEAAQRSFRQAVDYTENRKVTNSRSARACHGGCEWIADYLG